MAEELKSTVLSINKRGTHFNDYINYIYTLFHEYDIVELNAIGEQIHTLVLITEQLKNMRVADYNKLITEQVEIDVNGQKKSKTQLSAKMKKFADFHKNYREYFEKQNQQKVSK